MFGHLWCVGCVWVGKSECRSVKSVSAVIYKNINRYRAIWSSSKNDRAVVERADWRMWLTKAFANISDVEVSACSKVNERQIVGCVSAAAGDSLLRMLMVFSGACLTCARRAARGRCKRCII